MMNNDFWDYDDDDIGDRWVTKSPNMSVIGRLADMVAKKKRIPSQIYGTHTPFKSLMYKLDTDHKDDTSTFLKMIPKDVLESEEFFDYIIATRVKLSKIIAIFEESGIKISDEFFQFFLKHVWKTVAVDIFRIYIKEIIERNSINLILNTLNDNCGMVSDLGKRFVFNMCRKHLDNPLFDYASTYHDLCCQVYDLYVVTESNFDLIVGDNHRARIDVHMTHFSIDNMGFFIKLINSKLRFCFSLHRTFYENSSPEQVLNTIESGDWKRKKNERITELLECCAKKKLKEYEDGNIGLQVIDNFLLRVYAIRKSFVVEIANIKTTRAGNIIKDYRSL